MYVLRCAGCPGLEQSRTKEAIRAEMVELGEQGYPEVTLLGQNIDAYGRDLPALRQKEEERTRSPTCSITFMTYPALSGFDLPLAIHATLQKG